MIINIYDNKYMIIKYFNKYLKYELKTILTMNN